MLIPIDDFTAGEGDVFRCFALVSIYLIRFVPDGQWIKRENDQDHCATVAKVEKQQMSVVKGIIQTRS